MRQLGSACHRGCIRRRLKLTFRIAEITDIDRQAQNRQKSHQGQCDDNNRLSSIKPAHLCRGSVSLASPICRAWTHLRPRDTHAALVPLAAAPVLLEQSSVQGECLNGSTNQPLPRCLEAIRWARCFRMEPAHRFGPRRQSLVSAISVPILAQAHQALDSRNLLSTVVPSRMRV